jgi:geranylgeranyl diphosphate synthase, type I
MAHARESRSLPGNGGKRMEEGEGMGPGMFGSLLPEVRDVVRREAPRDWPELRLALGPVVDQPLGPRPTLPLAACAAVGGEPRAAREVAAAWEVVAQAGGILDDLQDGDRCGLGARVGPGRAFNFSAALLAYGALLLSRAPLPSHRVLALQGEFHRETLHLLAGQDLDLTGRTGTLEGYWATITGKTARAFAWACGAGARCGTDDLAAVDACRGFGLHLGLALQVLDDLQGVWEPVGKGDLHAGKITLPLLYGLEMVHPGRDELREMVRERRLREEAGRVVELLDAIGTREFLVWTALQERDRSLAALAPLRPAGGPYPPGVEALEDYATMILRHAGGMAGMEATP